MFLYSFDMFFIVMIVFLLLFLSGCFIQKSLNDDKFDENSFFTSVVNFNKKFNKNFSLIVKDLLIGLPCEKEISSVDKINLESFLQNSMFQKKDDEFYGLNFVAFFKINDFYELNGFSCCNFSLVFDFSGKSFKITNNACLIKPKNIQSFWVLEDEIINLKNDFL